jgi:hypothetical protein
MPKPQKPARQLDVPRLLVQLALDSLIVPHSANRKLREVIALLKAGDHGDPAKMQAVADAITAGKEKLQEAVDRTTPTQ